MLNKFSCIPLKDQISHRLETVWTAFWYNRHFMRKSKDILRKTEALRGRHQGGSAFILGCGPSLNKLDIAKIKRYQKENGFTVYSVNAFILSSFAEEMTPDYYLLSDPRFLYSPKTPGQKETADQTRERLKASKMPVFVPLEFFQRMDLPDVYAFCDAENMYSDNVTDVLKPRGFCSMTVLKVMMLALFMGHEKLYLGGIDCSDAKHLVVDKNNDVYMDYRYFYNGQKNLMRYQAFLGHPDMTMTLYMEHLLYYSFRKFSNQPIVNLDPDGLLDCFSKTHDLDVYKTAHESQVVS